MSWDGNSFTKWFENDLVPLPIGISCLNENGFIVI